MTDRETLAARIEAAGVDEQRVMLEEAFAYIHKMHDGLCPADWSALNWPFADRFTAMLDAEAYESAAMMLVPEGLFPSIDFVTKHAWLRTADGHDWRCRAAYGFAQTVPLALAAAAIRAGGV